MHHAAVRATGSVSVALGEGREAVVRWSRNRLHFHPRVFRLAFEGFGGAPEGEALGLAWRLFSAARTALVVHDPLLLRVTVEASDPLLAHLRRLGLLDARGVHVVRFAVPDLRGRALVSRSALGSAVRLVSLEEALVEVPPAALVEAWATAYGRAARLDPATPEELTEEELHDQFFGDADLDTDLSVCALTEGRLVGLCPVYRSEDRLEVELGTVGALAEMSERRLGVSRAMLRDVARRAADQGIELMCAEVDADLPESVYLFAEMPGRVVESLVSLMYVPRWAAADEPVG